MPIYEYKCNKCGEVFQRLQTTDAPKEGNPCPKCGSTDTTRVPSTFSASNSGCGGNGGFT